MSEPPTYGSNKVAGVKRNFGTYMTVISSPKKRLCKELLNDNQVVIVPKRQKPEEPVAPKMAMQVKGAQKGSGRGAVTESLSTTKASKHHAKAANAKAIEDIAKSFEKLFSPMQAQQAKATEETGEDAEVAELAQIKAANEVLPKVVATDSVKGVPEQSKEPVLPNPAQQTEATKEESSMVQDKQPVSATDAGGSNPAAIENIDTLTGGVATSENKLDSEAKSAQRTAVEAAKLPTASTLSGGNDTDLNEANISKLGFSTNEDVKVGAVEASPGDASSPFSFTASAGEYVLEQYTDNIPDLDLGTVEDYVLSMSSSQSVSGIPSATKEGIVTEEKSEISFGGKSESKENDTAPQMTTAPVGQYTSVNELTDGIASVALSEDSKSEHRVFKEKSEQLEDIKSKIPMSSKEYPPFKVREDSNPYSAGAQSKYFDRAAALPPHTLAKVRELMAKPVKELVGSASQKAGEQGDQDSEEDQDDSKDMESNSEIHPAMLETVDLNDKGNGSGGDEDDWEKIDTPEVQGHNGTRRKWYKLWRR